MRGEFTIPHADNKEENMSYYYDYVYIHDGQEYEDLAELESELRVRYDAIREISFENGIHIYECLDEVTGEIFHEEVKEKRERFIKSEPDDPADNIFFNYLKKKGRQ